MTPVQYLYYALGEVAYAIAKADGLVQKEEKEKFEKLLNTEFAKHNLDFDYASIIFQILKKDAMDPQTAYDWCLKQMRLNSQYVSETLKEKFIDTLKEVAKSYSPVTPQERGYIDDFIYQIKSIKGDPIFNKESGL